MRLYIPEHSETRTKTIFVIWPRKIGKFWIWLERIKVRQYYSNMQGWVDLEEEFDDWKSSR